MRHAFVYPISECPFKLPVRRVVRQGVRLLVLRSQAVLHGQTLYLTRHRWCSCRRDDPIELEIPRGHLWAIVTPEGNAALNVNAQWPICKLAFELTNLLGLTPRQHLQHIRPVPGHIRWLPL